jgi:hypothetical protein
VKDVSRFSMRTVQRYRNRRFGFLQVVPLNYLLRESAALAALRGLQSPELPIVKALRSRGSDVLEVRMSVPSSVWLQQSHPTRDAGGYEVRRREWKQHTSIPHTKSDWDAKTAYLVRSFPLQGSDGH